MMWFHDATSASAALGGNLVTSAGNCMYGFQLTSEAVPVFRTPIKFTSVHYSIFCRFSFFIGFVTIYSLS
jgi:hypothetical protein